MRRKDREMNREYALAIIDKSSYGLVSMVDQTHKPYGVPLSIVRQEDILYFHSAKAGKKVDIFASSPNVLVTFVGESKIPDNFSAEELEEMAVNEDQTGLFISQVFTTEYESALVEGQVELVEEEAEQIKALKLICEKYTPDKMAYFPLAIKAGLSKTNIYKIPISKITAKRKKYDDNGKEMKWGRMN